MGTDHVGGDSVQSGQVQGPGTRPYVGGKGWQADEVGTRFKVGV